MSGALLLTSFATWKPEQPSNSSDDLLSLVFTHRQIRGTSSIAAPHRLPPALYGLRQLPVDEALASRCVIRHIQQVKPGAVICCGMGERRTNLDVESTAVSQDISLKTSVNLERLIDGLAVTQISHDAGRFVCNGLYFEVLSYLKSHQPMLPCIFVHVPRLTPDNQMPILQDFLMLLSRIDNLVYRPERHLALI